MPGSGLSVLIVDLTCHSPVYTAYLSDALNRNSCRSVIVGIEKTEETTFLRHLHTCRARVLNISSVSKYTSLNFLLKGIEYVINWLIVLKKAGKYDVVHIQWLPGLSYSSLDLLFVKLLLKVNPCVVYTAHNILPHDAVSSSIFLRYQKLYDLIPRIVVHTNATKNRLIQRFGVQQSKIVVMPLGPIYGDIATNTDRPLRRSSLVGIIGTIRPYKGVEDAIKALKLLLAEGVHVELIIAGSGPKDYLTEIDQLVKKEGLERQIMRIYRYLPIPEMIKLYQSIRAFIAPYRRIDQSGAALTALSLGTPVVGYAVGGLTEVIHHGYNGFLVEPKNVEALAEGIKWVLQQNPDVLEQNCKESVKAWSWDRAAEILKHTYINLVRERRLDASRRV